MIVRLSSAMEPMKFGSSTLKLSVERTIKVTAGEKKLDEPNFIGSIAEDSERYRGSGPSFT